MSSLLTEWIDPASITVFGVVLGLSFGVSVGITSFLSWLRPPRAASGRTVSGVRRPALPNGPHQTWRMPSLRPALRHVWQRQSQAIVAADPIPDEQRLERLLTRLEPIIVQGRAARTLHGEARNRIETTDYAVSQLRRDLERLVRTAEPRQHFPAFAHQHISRRAALANWAA